MTDSMGDSIHPSDLLTLKLYYNSSNFLPRSLSPFHNFLLGEFKVLWLMASIIISIRKYDDDDDHDRDSNARMHINR